MTTKLGIAILALALPAAALAGEDAPLRTTSPEAVQSVHADSVRYAVRITDNNLVGATVTNYGFIGNNFVSRSPSLEYPLGLGYEHMVRGGFWIGAQAVDDQGAFIGVTTGAVDGAQGSSSQQATEFSPAGVEIAVRSTLPNSRYYAPGRAVSEQDYVTEFSDLPSRQVPGYNENHRALQILVRQENYAWSFSDYQHVLIFHLVIKNIGPPLANAWVGLYTEFASGNKNDYTIWPPSSSGSTVGSWFRKKWVVYEDSLRLFREHYCETVPIPEGCTLARAPYWIGKKLLGVSPGNLADTLDKRITLSAWDYSPGNTERDQDIERYALLSAGTIADLNIPQLQPNTGDPTAVLAVGPFAQIDPGDSIEVDFAIVGGQLVPDIQRHARFAQNAYDRDYIVPVPPPSPRFKAVARNNALDLYWDDSPESFSDPTSPIPQDFQGYRVHVGTDRLDLRRVAEFDAAGDTARFNTGFDAVRLQTPEVIDGVPYQYKYTVTNLRNGFKYFCAVTAFDLGNVEIESLESGQTQNKLMAVPAPAPGEVAGTEVTVFPNPYRVEAMWDQGQQVRDHYLWFANMPEKAKLKIFTLSGDVVYETDFDGATYAGLGTRGLYDPQRELDVDAPTLSGALFAWDMITDQGQAIASGLYIFAVEDKSTGKRAVGKFLVVKSDREGF